MGSVLDEILPGNKALNRCDEQETRLRDEFGSGDITEDQFRKGMRALEVKREKAFKSLNRAMGWDKAKPRPAHQPHRQTRYIEPEPPLLTDIVECPEVVRVRRKRYKASICLFVVLVGLYLVFGDNEKNHIKPLDTTTETVRICDNKAKTPDCKKMQKVIDAKTK